jgi:hypothetical protein
MSLRNALNETVEAEPPQLISRALLKVQDVSATGRLIGAVPVDCFALDDFDPISLYSLSLPSLHRQSRVL